MLLELKKNGAIIFVLSLKYWLQIKEFQLELVFSKKEFEGRFELPTYGEGRKAAGFQEHRSQRLKATRTHWQPLLSILTGHFILALPPKFLNSIACDSQKHKFKLKTIQCLWS